MFWYKEAIEGLGFESVDDFVESFVEEYSNCCVRFAPDGVYLDYDFDTDIIDKFNNVGCVSFSFTEEEWKEILNRQ